MRIGRTRIGRIYLKPPRRKLRARTLQDFFSCFKLKQEKKGRFSCFKLKQEKKTLRDWTKHEEDQEEGECSLLQRTLLSSEAFQKMPSNGIYSRKCQAMVLSRENTKQ